MVLDSELVAVSFIDTIISFSTVNILREVHMLGETMDDQSFYQPLVDDRAVRRVDPADQDAIRALGAALCETKTGGFPPMSAVRRSAYRLSDDLVDFIDDFRLNSNDYGTLLLRGLPIGQIPDTPPTGVASAWPELSCADRSITMIMSLLGEPIAYADEKEGALIQDVIPVQGCEERQENSGSALLEFHIENGFHPHKPSHVGLLGLRGDHLGIAATATASIRRALPLLSGVVIDCLRQPLFRIRLSSSFTADDLPPLRSCAAPILTGHPLRPDLTVDFHATEPLSKEAESALVLLREAMAQVMVGAVLTPGDLLIVDNRTAAHARTAFTPRYDGHDRWLRRMSCVADLRDSSGSRALAGRVFSPVPLLHLEASGQAPE